MSAAAAESRDRRALAAATALVPAALGLWLAAVTTDFWFHVELAPGTNGTTGFVRSHSGLFTLCKFALEPKQPPDAPPRRSCHNHRLFPSEEWIRANPELDSTILDYTRTEMAFALLSCVVMALGLGFSVYALREPRYMFKRLAAGVHLIAAACTVVVLEVVSQSVDYEQRHLVARHPRGATWRYGFSFVLGAAGGALELAVGLAHLLLSRKRKGGPDDAPNILGRA